jgi:hypothetical protein
LHIEKLWISISVVCMMDRKPVRQSIAQYIGVKQGVTKPDGWE